MQQKGLIMKMMGMICLGMMMKMLPINHLQMSLIQFLALIQVQLVHQMNQTQLLRVDLCKLIMSMMNPPGIITAAVWAITMTHLLDYIAQHLQGNGTHIMRRPVHTMKSRRLPPMQTEQNKFAASLWMFVQATK